VTGKYIGKRILRNEDPRLLTGQALFVDDVDLPGMLHVAFYRSDFAHARLKSVDVSAARKRPGVIAVFTAEDMGEDWKPGPPLVSPPPTAKDVVFHSRTQVPLVKDKVRYAGEPIAVVVAESRYIAEDAVEDILVDLEPLEAVADLEKGLLPDSPWSTRISNRTWLPTWSRSRATMIKLASRPIWSSDGASSSNEARQPLWKTGASSPSGIPKANF
jgi:carbon-monoxide dehydrogenase large subunit